jgi:hypothetical protein
MGKSLDRLKEDRFHLKYLLQSLDLSPDVRTISGGLLVELEKQITAAEKPN